MREQQGGRGSDVHDEDLEDVVHMEDRDGVGESVQVQRELESGHRGSFRVVIGEIARKRGSDFDVS